MEKYEIEKDWDGNVVKVNGWVNSITGQKEDSSFFNWHNKYGGFYSEKHMTPYEIPIFPISMLKYGNGNRKRLSDYFPYL